MAGPVGSHWCRGPEHLDVDRGRDLAAEAIFARQRNAVPSRRQSVSDNLGARTQKSVDARRPVQAVGIAGTHRGMGEPKQRNGLSRFEDVAVVWCEDLDGVRFQRDAERFRHRHAGSHVGDAQHLQHAMVSTGELIEVDRVLGPRQVRCQDEPRLGVVVAVPESVTPLPATRAARRPTYRNPLRTPGPTQ